MVVIRLASTRADPDTGYRKLDLLDADAVQGFFEGTKADGQSLFVVSKAQADASPGSRHPL